MSSDAGAPTEIFIVDDEQPVLETLAIVFRHAGFRVRTFPDGAAFLQAAKAITPACVLLDVRMPGRSGLDILKELNAQHYPAPIFIMSGHADVPMAVEATRSGAHDVIEKPFNGADVVNRVREALEARAQPRETEKTQALWTDFPGRVQLTARERDVLEQITLGASNKEAGRRLGISPRTIEVHRARIMEKIGARNAADLVRIVLGSPRG